MPDTGYFAVFLIGLLGGTHCVSMCGGIVGALTLQLRSPGSKPQWSLHLAYNLGRIATYTVLGGLVGALGSVGMVYDGMLPVQMTLYVLANLMLVALGLYLTGFTRPLAPLERAGHVVWRQIKPATRRFLPARSVRQALPLGLLWGFIPCGLTYSILATALVSGSGARGAGLMLAFGLGTLPNLLLAGMLFLKFRAFTRSSKVRLASGVVVLGFGLFGLYHAPTLGGALWRGIVCL